MEVLVLGGTGSIGDYLVPMLLAAGHGVTVLSRGQRRPAFWSDVRHVAADRSTEGLSSLAGERFDAVIDNIAYEPVHIRQVAAALGEGAGHYLFTSTAFVGEPRQGAELRAEEVDLQAVPPDFRDNAHARYVYQKRQAELLLHEGILGNRWSILRPVNIYGPEDRQGRLSWWVARLLDGQPLLLPDDFPAITLAGHNMMVFARDVAAAQMACLGNPAAFGGTYQLAMTEAPAVPEWIQILAEALDRETPELIAIPRRMLAHSPLAANAAGTYRVPGLFGGWRYDVTPAREVLGWRPTPLSDWLPTVARAIAGRLAAGEGPAVVGLEQRALEVQTARRWQELLAEAGTRLVGES
ncbi:MAG: NAD-dependent epimerase/dehydratase family protein [Mycobacterium leprae]